MFITCLWQMMKTQLWQSALPDAVDEKTHSASLAAGAHPPSTLPHQRGAWALVHCSKLHLQVRLMKRFTTCQLCGIPWDNSQGHEASLMSLTAHVGHLSGASSWPALRTTEDAPWGTSTRGLLCPIAAERQTAAAASWETGELGIMIHLCVWNVSFLSFFFRNAFSSFYWSLVFFKLSLQEQLFLFFL